MSVNQNNAQVIAACNQRITALKKHVTTTKATMMIGGEAMKLADVLAVYQEAIDTRGALVAERAAYEKALTERDDADAARLALDEGLRGWVGGQFGYRGAESQEFGFLPRKVRVKSAQTKADAVVKAKATREARGTKGSRQKADIKGTIDAPAGPAAPATTTTAAAPAASVQTSSNGASTNASSTNGAAASH